MRPLRPSLSPLRGRRRLGALACAVLLLALAGTSAVVVAFPALRWRVQVLLLMARGGIPDLSWGELLSMLSPGSRHYLENLLATPNPYAVILNPYNSDADREVGEALFRRSCAACHGAGGYGESAVALNRGEFLQGDSDWALYRTITRGVPGTAMIGWDLPDREVWQVIAYLRSLVRPMETPRETGGRAALPEPVLYERILRAEQELESWLTYSGGYASWRYSRLDQIDRGNVASLRLEWVFQMPTADPFVETTPIVVGDHMYVTEPPGNVLALDPVTGRQRWAFRRTLPSQLSLCCGRVNRGVAVLDDKVYLGTLDANLLALDAATGELVWEVEVGDPAGGFSITTAPLAVRDMILIGVSGGEHGIRGYLDAYDAKSGEPRWRFYTIPAPGEPGSETWAGDSWRTGGGPTWLTGSFDPELDLVYWGVGNPAPDFNGDVRPGDNLYTNAAVALDADSGELVWHYQFTPHDEHDWDANQIPVLVDLTLEGHRRKAMLWANKNGFFYVLDRESGEFLAARAFAKQTWSDGFDSTGRPRVRADSRPTEKGTLTYPGAGGATNWSSPSFSPLSHLFYVPTLEQGKVFFKGAAEFEEGQFFLGSASSFLPGEPYWTGLRALVPETGELRWEVAGPEREDWGRLGGALSTAGGLVFWGDDTLLLALDSDTGEELWRVNLGGKILAAPISYRSQGAQYVTIAAGRSILAFGLPETER